MKRLIVGVIAAYLSIAFIGCSGFDSTQIIVHPDSVAVSSPFDVALVNAYMYIDTGKTISKTVTRDSLHLLVGLPESWSVLGAQMVKISDMKTNEMLALQSGALDQQALAALIQKYQTQTVALAADAGLPAALKGQTVSAHSADASTKVDVTIDKVKQWSGFSAPVGIVLNKGDKQDTILPLDSAISFAIGSGMMPDSIAATVASVKSNGLFKLPDTIGISVIPVAIFLKIKAGSAPGTDTLYYFSKTDSMNPKPSSIVSTATLLGMTGLKQMEAGDMTFVPVVVNSAAAVRSRSVQFSGSGVKVIADRTTGSVRINIGSFNPAQTSVGIYSMRGVLLESLMPHNGEVVWNGFTARGQNAPAGMYLVRIFGAAGSVVRAVQMVR